LHCPGAAVTPNSLCSCRRRLLRRTGQLGGRCGGDPGVVGLLGNSPRAKALAPSHTACVLKSPVRLGWEGRWGCRYSQYPVMMGDQALV